jgi:hypothetical protein
MTDPLEQIASLLRSEKTFLVLTHYRPDGDAIGGGGPPTIGIFSPQILQKPQTLSSCGCQVLI